MRDMREEKNSERWEGKVVKTMGRELGKGKDKEEKEVQILGREERPRGAFQNLFRLVVG